jgi:hypothetical protein
MTLRRDSPVLSLLFAVQLGAPSGPVRPLVSQRRIQGHLTSPGGWLCYLIEGRPSHVCEHTTATLLSF